MTPPVHRPQLKRSPFCSVYHCGMPAEYFPVLHVWAKGMPKAEQDPVIIEIGASLCAHHKTVATIGDFPNVEEAMTEITKRLRKAEPDFSTAILYILPLAPPEEDPA